MWFRNGQSQFVKSLFDEIMKIRSITFSCNFIEKIGLRVNFSIDDSITCESFFGAYGFEVNPEVLFSSFFKGTSDFLFSCGCGVPGCSGIYCECGILHHEKIVIWLIPNPVSVNTGDTKPIDCGFDIFRFDKKMYKKNLKQCAQKALEITDFTFNDRIQNDYFIYNYKELKSKLERIASADLEHMY